MRGFAYRLLTYLLTGLSAGFAGWLLVCRAPSSGGFGYPAVAAVFLIFAGFIAFILLRKSDIRTSREDMIISPGQILASDLTCIVAAAVASFFIVDGFSERLFGIKACVTDPLAADVIAFMLLPAAAVLALFVTQTGSQRIRCDATGFSVESISGPTRLLWEDIMSFRPERQHVLVGRVGFLVPRHLRTNIVVVRHNADNVTIFDPGTRGTRRSLLAKLRSAMPIDKRTMLEEIEDEWV